MSFALRVLTKLGIEVIDKGGDRKAFGLCPFHQPSSMTCFFIRLRGERRGQYHCFSCKAKGGLADLVAHARGCSLDDARDWIDRQKTDGGEDEGGAVYLAARVEVAPLGRAGFRMPKEVVLKPPEEWPTPARDYARKRHLGAGQVARWGIGYASVGRLAGRIVIPVSDQGGWPRSYMARTFVDHPIRYYYPRLSDGPDLDVIFGEQHWPEPDERRLVIVTEGALNALAVERALEGHVRDFNVAALGGSDPRPMHVAKIAQFPRTIVLTDEDPAGRGAAAVLGAQLARHTKTVRVSLGEGRDADDVEPEELRNTLCRAITGTSGA